MLFVLQDGNATLSVYELAILLILIRISSVFCKTNSVVSLTERLVSG